MKLKSILSCLAVVLFSASAAFAQSTLAKWTFETSVPTTAGPFSPEIGSGSASGSHVGATVYSSPAGNGSSHSFSSTLWAVGDYYQFTVSTVGAQHIVVTFSQTSSGTGPGQFQFEYSTDGIHFTSFGSPYTVLDNGLAPNPAWTSSSAAPVYNFTNDLSSVTAITNASTVYFRLVDSSTTSSSGGTVGTAGTSRVDNFTVTASTGTPPTISGILPSSITTNAGNAVSFTVTLSAGDTPLTYFWYKETALTTNLISTVTTNTSTGTLMLPNVLLADAANYQVVVSNASTLTATSAVVSLTVIDPAINVQPASQVGLLGGTVQFPVSAAGTGITGYQWYFCTDPNNNAAIASPVNNGTQGSGAVVSGAATSTLTITNLTTAAPTNFVVVVTGTYGAVTSSVASLTVANTGPLAFWNFNGAFNITNPAPYQGIGTASGVNVVTFLQPNASGNDPAVPNTAWGTSTYPAQGTSNKLAGAQFMVSTVGAKNVTVSYDTRATATASKYQRLQYTTNGTDFIDFPTSSSIASVSANFYVSFNYSLAGFPGAANNPHFGIRIMTEFESTASYGNTNNANYVAVGSTSTYGSAGTLSYDLVTISADAITNANTPPTITAIPDQTVEDTFGSNVTFTVGDTETPAGSLSVTAASLDPTVSVGLAVNNLGGGSRRLVISSSLGNSANVNVPILVTVTDGNGDSTVTWFTLTITAANQPPVISGLMNTNMIGNSTLVIPFTLTDDHTAPATITPTVFSGNTTLVSNDVAHVSLGGSGANRTLTITPVTNQFGTVPITISASDGSLSTTPTFILVVRPNTNVVLVDNFDYDGSGAIISQSGGFWQTHSGIAGQMQVGSGMVTVDGVNNSEDVNAPLIGQPYMTNSGAVLYSRYIVNYTQLPDATGSYFGHFKDNTTFGFLARVWAFSNSPTTYRIGIANSTSTSASAVPFPQDLVLNSNYVVVTRLVLSNAFSTVWINPSSESSPGVTDITDITTNKVNIYSYAFRESTADEGILTVSNLSVGLSFAAVTGIVLPAQLNIQLINNQAVLSWTDNTFLLQAAPAVTGTYTNVPGSSSPYTNAIGNPAKFYRLIH
jgi:hypothetical protein